MKSTKKIWINPVERISFQGRHKQVYTIKTDQGIIPTVSMRKSREDNTASHYQFPINPHTNKLETGLNVLVTNPFKDSDPDDMLVDYKLSNKWVDILPKLVNKDKIKKQTLFEIRHGVEPDYYTDEVRYSITNMPSDMSDWGKKTFLQGLVLTLYPRPNPLDNGTPRQELLMEMVNVVNTIAKSKEVQNSAYHDWYISEEHEAEIEKAQKREVVEKATYHLYKLKNEYDAFQAYKIAIVLRDVEGRPILKGKVINETVSNVLSSYIAPGKQQMRNVEEFLNISELLTTREGVEKINIQYLFQQALNTNVIAFRDNEYVWHSKAGTPDVYQLGRSYENAINMFLKEYRNYNSDSDITNWYADLQQEVAQKNIKFE